MIVKAKKYQNNSALTSVYYFVYRYFTYSNQVLYIAYTIHQNELIFKQKQTGAKYFASTNKFFVTLASSNPFMSTCTLQCYSCFVFITIWYQTTARYSRDINSYDTRQ